MPFRLAPLFLLLGSLAHGTEPTVSFKELRPLLEAHCIKCHGPAKQRGKVDLAPFADEKSIRTQRKLWLRVVEQVKTLEMPPAGETPLSAEQRDRLVRGIEQTLAVVDCSDPAQRDPGPPLLRRLNRTEYTRTVRDLFGIEFDPAAAVGMASDPTGQSFDNLSEALSLSPVLLESYFAAADHVLDRLLPPLRDGVPSKAPPGAHPGDKKAAAALLFMRPGKSAFRQLAARQILDRAARRAYRRPVTPAEIERLLAIFDRADAANGRFDDAVRLPLKAMLVSPHFLFRIEHDENPAAPYRIDEHELAVRLSYFLWSTMPDAELMRLADMKQLFEPATLDAQVRRMLADPKANALTENFAEQWLQLRKLAEARPSTEFFPTFTHQLRHALHDETALFFDALRTEDGSLRTLLDADYTFLNEDLAKHYGIDGIKGKELRRVQLKPGDHRGGLLGMGSILAMTSHTSRTSPTLRGKWILDVIFGTPPPPPPPEAGTIDERKEKNKAKTFRELLALHASQPTCAACHNKMDPLGFALENYDAVGRWRDHHGGQPLDTSAKLPTGETLNGPVELKRLIASRQDAFVRNVTEQMFVYALGRELQASDECALRDVTAALGRDNQRFSTLILGVVRSYPFQHRRNPAKENP